MGSVTLNGIAALVKQEHLILSVLLNNLKKVVIMILEKLKSLGVGIVELIGIATSFLFVTGVAYYYGYYDAGLNANWIINLLTTKELLISNLRLGVAIALAFMYLSTSDLNDKRKIIQTLIFGCSFLGLILIYSILKNDRWLESLGYFLAFLSIFGIIYSHFFLKIICTLTLVLVIPFLNGVLAYQVKSKSALPIVLLKDQPKKWFLFDTFSDQAILIDSMKKQKTVKVVKINDLQEIKVR